MDWNTISKNYINIGISLYRKTDEGTTGTRIGLGRSGIDYIDIRRTHKILLRVAFEFILKGLFIKNGHNIYQYNGQKRIIPITQITDYNKLNTDEAVKFSILIDEVDKISTNLTHLKPKLHKIREEGNKAIHSEEVDIGLNLDAVSVFNEFCKFM